MQISLWTLLSLSMMLPDLAAATPSCGGEPGWASREITGTVTHPEPFVSADGPPTFVLMPAEHGWRIGVLDGDGLESPLFAAPLRPVDTNPLNISGWHFRNRDNTGPNTGDVNAPQHERRFTFGTLATGPAALSDIASPAGAGGGLGGLGVLTITDLALTPPAPGARAGFTSLSFSVCLVWQGDGDRPDPIAVADPGVAFEVVVDTLRDCGLDTGVYRLSDRMSQGREGAQRPYLEPDMDGDGTADLVVPATRLGDAAPGLAICLAGPQTLVMAGYDGRIGRLLDPGYFGRVDGWRIHSGPIPQSADEGPPPTLNADALSLSKDDSSSVIVYLTPDLTVSSYWQGD